MMTLEEQAYVRKIEETIVKLEARTAELECRLNMNSSNSSKTLSRDKSSQKKRSLRKSLGKKPIVHADATGVRALVWTTWLHHVSTELYTYQYVSKKHRGKAQKYRKNIYQFLLLPTIQGILARLNLPRLAE